MLGPIAKESIAKRAKGKKRASKKRKTTGSSESIMPKQLGDLSESSEGLWNQEQIAARKATKEKLKKTNEDVTSQQNKRGKARKPRSPCLMISSSCDALHGMDTIGIDTDSGKSMSTRVADFLWIDVSKEAQDSIEITGVGGSDTDVGGREPLVVRKFLTRKEIIDY